MSMGFGSNFAETISEESIAAFCPDELGKLVEAVKRVMSWEDFASEAQYDDIQDEDIKKAYAELCNKFHDETGLGLYIGFHNSEDNGSSYDDIDGAYWCVDGVWQQTVRAKKFEKAGHKIQRKFFVTYG